jgi:NADH-quinone oxidoreductase subunit D
LSVELVTKDAKTGRVSEPFSVNMGPQHPSTHGVLRLELTMDGEVVVDAIPHVGFLHRSIEKLAENRKYFQFVPFTDRVDYCASMPCNHAYVLAVEKLAGDIEVPERAEYLRVIMDELNRIASHLIFFAVFTLDLGAITPFLYGFREREDVIDLFEMTCGQRLTYNYIRIGGVSKDIPPQFAGQCRKFLKSFPARLDEYEALMNNNPIFLVRTKGVSVLSREDAIALGVTGPQLRATGLEFDIRKNEPYSAYPRFDFEIPTGENSDTWDRYKMRLDEMRQSTRIIEQALDGLPEGPVMTKIPRNFKPAPGECYSRIEAPRGEMGYYIVSDGNDKPYRVKIRTGSFGNLQALPHMIRGWKIADVVAVFGSLDVVLPEVDR